MSPILIAGLVIFGAAQLYVRHTPADLSRWHVDPRDVRDAPGVARLSFRIEMLPQQAAAIIEAVAMDTPRTRLVAGSVKDRHMTFVSRSLFWGFPDYTTVMIEAVGEGSRITLYGRARFGRHDFGVNAARIKAWRDAIATGFGY